MLKRKTKNITYILLAVACIFSFLLPITLAYFYDQNSSSQSGTIGQVKLGSSTGATFSENFIVGEGNILTAPISVAKDANSQNLYVRLKLDVAFENLAPQAGDVLGGHILSATNINEINDWIENLKDNMLIVPSANSSIVAGGTDSTVAWSGII